MGNWWIRFGCFLTGHNYNIVRNSSELTAKSVKRYTSAILIVCIIWAFVGYTFTGRYLEGGLISSIVGAIIAVLIIVQIERQIILSVNPSIWLYVSRGLIASLMAIIGAVIIDQIILHKDIELEKGAFIEKRIEKALPAKSAELRKQIAALNSIISDKEIQRLSLIDDVSKKPMVPMVSKESKPQIIKHISTDSTGRQTTTEKVKNTTAISVSNIQNPKFDLIAPLEKDINNLRIDIAKKQETLLNMRQQLEEDFNSKVGFLDELEVMHSLISRSNVAFTVWIIWFLLLLGLESLVLISKINDKESDYEKTVKHHMDLQIRKLDALARAANVN